MRHTLERIWPLTGILTVALWIVGLVVMEGVTDPPADDAGAEAILSWYQSDSNGIAAGAFLFMLGGFTFFWFLGALRDRLVLAEPGPGTVTALVFGSGVATAVFALGTPGGDIAAAINNEDLGAPAAEALNTLGDLFFIGAEVSAAVLLSAVGVLVLRTRVLPVWLGWVSLVIALWLLIAPVGWAALIFAFPLWIIAVSLLLFMRAPRAVPATATATV
jgi:hypothetical protein